MNNTAAISLARTGGFYSFGSVVEWLFNHIEIFVVVGIVGLLQLTSAQYRYLAPNIVEHPRKNDFFYVDYLAIDANSDFSYRYIPMKVIAVNNDVVRFKVGNIAHSKPVSPRQHAQFDAAMQRNYYRADAVELSRQQIEQLFDSGAIYTARRPDNIYIDGWIVLSQRELVEE
ncbi:hypothetical protein [Neptunicella sp. SCSIO 80796]|uniref:hypothetical protein n=1 Tax=Neptunicella plasticusilytica TaxID=3117012 RepID=UPI003A4DC333